jgi:hypothetical protein
VYSRIILGSVDEGKGGGIFLVTVVVLALRHFGRGNRETYKTFFRGGILKDFSSVYGLEI